MIMENDIVVLFTKNPNKNPEAGDWYRKNGETVKVYSFGKEMFKTLDKAFSDGYGFIILSIDNNYIITQAVPMNKGKLYKNMMTLTMDKNHKNNVSYMGQLMTSPNLHMTITSMNIRKNCDFFSFNISFYDTLGDLVEVEVLK
jgi:hypothetical protein|nr:MAG TPA: hypothetical protein [Caudoviricetes sp.]